jgi:hypothetical protein
MHEIIYRVNSGKICKQKLLYYGNQANHFCKVNLYFFKIVTFKEAIRKHHGTVC